MNVIHMEHEPLIININVKELFEILKKEKPKRFSKTNEDDKFNHPPITDFAFVNLKLFYTLISLLKQTRVETVQIKTNYDRCCVEIRSIKPEFCYSLKFC